VGLLEHPQAGHVTEGHLGQIDLDACAVHPDERGVEQRGGREIHVALHPDRHAVIGGDEADSTESRTQVHALHHSIENEPRGSGRTGGRGYR
jgi:hypothetical protein